MNFGTEASAGSLLAIVDWIESDLYSGVLLYFLWVHEILSKVECFNKVFSIVQCPLCIYQYNRIQSTVLIVLWFAVREVMILFVTTRNISGDFSKSLLRSFRRKPSSNDFFTIHSQKSCLPSWNLTRTNERTNERTDGRTNEETNNENIHFTFHFCRFYLPNYSTV